jgi:hypothetical protein
VSGTPEQINQISNKIKAIQAKAKKDALNFTQDIEGKSQRLLDLEIAFHIWHAHYHWLLTTGFDYFVLERTIKELFHGRFAFKLTQLRRSSMLDRPDGVLRIATKNDSVIFTPGAKDLKTFERDLERVKKHAQKVSLAIQKNNQQAVDRLVHLEVAHYLFVGYCKLVKSTSPRWKRLQAVLLVLSPKRKVNPR